MPRTCAVTLIELLVIVSLILVLIGMLLPMASIHHGPASKTACGSNQRQILIAMLVYTNDNGGAWPVRPSDQAGAWLSHPGHDKYTAIGSFEFLAAQMSDMPARIFSCPCEREYHPPGPASHELAAHPDTAASSWCVAAARNVHANPGYLFDWAVPANAPPTRIVIADRARVGQDHQNHVLAAFADGHVASIKPGKITPAADETLGLDDRSDGTSYANPDIAADNIYDGSGDGGQPWTVGSGSATRAWVR